MSNALSFFKEFIKHPTKVGAIAPSSAELAQEMMLQAHISQSQNVAEFGAGTGVFTKEILRILPLSGKFIAIEQNPAMVALLHQNLKQSAKDCAPELRERMIHPPIYCDTVENLPKLMEKNGVLQLDSIVSGLPWATFDEDLQNRLLGVAIDSLKSGGYFVTFAYLQGLMVPAGQRFAHKIKAQFSSVNKSRIVWGNLPPAFVYCCQK